MVAFWFGVVSVLCGVGFLIASRFSYDDYGKDVKLTFLRWVALGFAIFAAILFVSSSVYSQDPGESLVIKSPSGSIAKIDTTDGWGFTAPWNSTATFNVRNQRIEMTTDSGGNGADGPSIPSPLANGSNADVPVVVVYSIKPDGVRSIYTQQKSQDNLVDNVLKPDIWTTVRDVTADMSPFEVKQNRAMITTEVLDLLAEKWDEIGVIANDVNIGQITLDEETEAAFTQLNEKEVKEEAARADLSRARIEAETTKTEAQAQADADQIIRCGADVDTATEVVNGQETEVVIVTPKVGQECEDRLNAQVITNNWIQALEKMGADGNLIVVSDDVQAILDAGGTPRSTPE